MTGALVFHLLPHTHWDREWYLPRGTLLVRLVEMLDDVVGRLEADVSLTFLLDGQTVHIEDYLRVRPDARARVAVLVRAGRLQVGPWYVLADELIPSGEALVRNLLFGAADAARLGARVDVLYSPDAFGHPAALPLLAREFGLNAALLWRGLGGEPGEEGDLFRWRGAAGDVLPLIHLPPGGYELGADLPPDSSLHERWRPLRAALAARARTRHVLLPVGADHHAMHRGLVALSDRLAALEPRHEVRISRLDDYAAAALADAGALPELTGELRRSYGYTWTLQGTHGTRARQKRRNSRLELLLERRAEPLAALSRLGGATHHRAALLHEAWRTLVRAQFHDVLCGTVSDEVARTLDTTHDDVAALASEIARRTLEDLAGYDADRARERPDRFGTPELLLWNPAPRPRGGVVEATLTWFRRDVLVGPPGARRARSGSGPGAVHLVAADGTPVPLQLLAREPGRERLDAMRHYPDLDEVEQVRVALRAPSIGGMALDRLTVARGARRASGAARLAGRTLRNPRLEATLNLDGSLDLIDRVRGERYPALLRLEVDGDRGDTYTRQAPPHDRVVRSRGPARAHPLARGPLLASVGAEWTMRAGRDPDRRARGAIAIGVVAEVADDTPWLRVRLTIDNAATDCRLRARIPTGLAGVSAVAGAPFGAIERGALGRTRRFPAESPVPTAPAHRFVAAARGARGVALLLPGFFEYEWTAAGDCLLTIFRSVSELSRAALPARPGHAAWPAATPLARELGLDTVELALMPLDAAMAARPDLVLSAWEDCFAPLEAHWFRDAAGLAIAPVGVELEGPLVLSALKPAEEGDAVVLRCYNPRGDVARGAWRFARPVARAERCRADETTAVEPLPLSGGGTRCDLAVAPFDVATVRVYLSPTA